MLDFLFHIWFWLLAALAIGLAVGALFRRRPAQGGVARWLFWTGLAFLAGGFASALGALNGATDLYVLNALATYAAFLLGAVIGTLGAGGSLRAHEGWAAGLIPAALIFWGATHFAQPSYLAELQRQAVTAATRASVDATGLTVSGRDVNAPLAVSRNAALMREMQKIPGVRGVIAAAKPAAATEAELKSVEDSPPGRPGPERPYVLKGDVTPTRPMALADPRAVLATLPVGPLNSANCQAALTAAAILDRIEFREASTVITRRASEALDKAAVLIRRCPDVTIEVGGHADGLGSDSENDELSRRRADAAMRYLLREGVSGRRLIAVGYGASRPIVPNGAQELRALNRTIDFIVR